MDKYSDIVTAVIANDYMVAKYRYEYMYLYLHSTCMSTLPVLNYKSGSNKSLPTLPVPVSPRYLYLHTEILATARYSH